MASLLIKVITVETIIVYLVYNVIIFREFVKDLGKNFKIFLVRKMTEGNDRDI